MTEQEAKRILLDAWYNKVDIANAKDDPRIVEAALKYAAYVNEHEFDECEEYCCLPEAVPKHGW